MSTSFSKLFGCNVHDSIRIYPMALKIINTPEFQRMRHIKQLALCYHVYPAATHTRFEHSIGVYHLAGKMLEKIASQYPNYTFNIPELGSDPIVLDHKIIECVKIAALCHDIGHGPFSHIFDDILLRNSIHPNRHHETRSCLIIEMLCKRELADELTDNHIKFIKSIVDPSPKHTGALYQIVSNNLNGIDVDKFDYLARDSKNLGIGTSFNATRIINEFIIDNNGNIAYPKHCTTDIYELFHCRYMMHKKVYCHKTVKIIELMMSDIFNKIDPIFGISRAINDMAAFCKLTDNTIYNYMELIMNPPPFIETNLTTEQLGTVTNANNIYQKIINRDLYMLISEMTGEPNIPHYLDMFLDYLIDHNPNINLTKSDFSIVKSKIGYVSGNKNDPFKSIYFYDKKENANSFVIDRNYISDLMNNKIQETHWYLVYRGRIHYQLVADELAKFNLLD